MNEPTNDTAATQLESGHSYGADAWFHVEIDVRIEGNDKAAAEAKVKKLDAFAASLGLTVSTNYEDLTT